MTRSSLVFACLLVCAPAAAQEEEPSYDTSIALHVSAVITGVLGTTGFTGYFIYGACDGDPGCYELWLGSAIAGTVMLLGSIALGIAASVVHADTYVRRRSLASTIMPLLWAHPDGAGGGLLMRF